MSDIHARLQAALADRYVLGREIGRGGMATVYLAQDLKHDRSGPPEIAAGLGPERFLRETRLTARLQHPHILSVFDSGAVVGRPSQDPLELASIPGASGPREQPSTGRRSKASGKFQLEDPVGRARS